MERNPCAYGDGQMLDIFKNVNTDRRDEFVLTIIAIVVPLVAVYAMAGV